MRTTLFIILAFVISGHAFSQGYYYGATDILSPKDTAILRADDYTGAIQWQKSYDKILWIDIFAAHDDSLMFIADSSTYFRAKVDVPGCAPYYSDTIQVPVMVQNENIITPDSLITQLISDSLQLIAGQYTYIGIDTALLMVNQPFIDPRTEDMRLITGYSQSGDTIRIETEPADLTDFISDIELEDSMVLVTDAQEGLKHAMLCNKIYDVELLYKAPGADFKAGGVGINFDGSTLYDGTVSYENNGHTVTGHLNVMITKGSLTFNPGISRKIKIRWGKIKEFKLVASGTVDYNMDIKVSSDIQYDFSKEILLAKYSFRGPWFGVIPSKYHVYIYGGFTSHVDANGEVTFGFDVRTTTRIGAQYDGSWNPVFSQSTTFTKHTPSFDSEFNINNRAHLRPQIKFILGNVAGPKMDVKPYLEFQGTIEYPEWRYTLYGGMDASVGFEVKLLKKTLANYNKNYKDVVRKEIYSQSNAIASFVMDTDNNRYEIIDINGKLWMGSNLKTTLYNDGTAIEYKQLLSSKKPSYYWYADNPNYKAGYGALYNWYAVDTKKLCPSGWHVPSIAEWDAMVNSIGGSSIAGGKLKEKGTTHWTSPNTGATDEFGFGAVGAGYRAGDNNYVSVKTMGIFWSTSQSDASNGLRYRLLNSNAIAFRANLNKGYAMSVRCTKD